MRKAMAASAMRGEKFFHRPRMARLPGGPPRGASRGQSCDFQMVVAQSAVKCMSTSALSPLGGRFNTSGGEIRRGRPCASFAVRGLPSVGRHPRLYSYALWGYAQPTTSKCRPAGAVGHRRGGQHTLGVRPCSGCGHAMDNAARRAATSGPPKAQLRMRRTTFYSPSIAAHPQKSANIASPNSAS